MSLLNVDDGLSDRKSFDSRKKYEIICKRECDEALHDEDEPPEITNAQRNLNMVGALIAVTEVGCFPVFMIFIHETSQVDELVIMSIFLALSTLILGLHVFIRKEFYKLLAAKRLLLLIILSILRHFSFIISLTFSQSVYLQVVYLTIVIITPITQRYVIIRKLLPCTSPAILLTFFGGFLAILGDIIETSDPVDRNFILGMCFMSLYAVMTAFFYCFVSEVDLRISQISIQWACSAGSFFAISPFAIGFYDWKLLKDIDLPGGMMLCLLVIMGLMAPILNIQASRIMSPAFVSNLVPWFLIPTTFLNLSALINQPVSDTSFVGIVIVFCATLVFMLYQYKYFQYEAEAREKREGLNSHTTSTVDFSEIDYPITVRSGSEDPRKPQFR